jgi:hypothetical protein
MNREINKLLKDIGKENKDIYNRLVSIARKTDRRKNYLVIDIIEMESIVDADKVESVPAINRVEVEV